jgi:hypothetical protein
MVIGTIEEEWKKRKREENFTFSVQREREETVERGRENCGKNKN